MTLHRSQKRAVLAIGFEGLQARLQADEATTLRLLLDHAFQRVETQARKHGGWLFRREAEGLWCSFPSPLAALRAAASLLEEEAAQLPIRIGAHFGGVTLLSTGDVLGHTLSVAKRLETACPPGAALVSRELHERLPECKLPLALSALGELELKGVGGQEALLGRPLSLRSQETAASQSLWLIAPTSANRLDWERRLLRESSSRGGDWGRLGDALWWAARSELAWEVARSWPASRRLLLESPFLAGPAGPHGASVERALQALRAGWQELVLVNLAGAARLPQELPFEAYLNLGEELFYAVGSASPLDFAHQPRVLRSWRAGQPFDVVVGYAQAVVPAAVTRRALETEPDLELPVLVAGQAALRGVQLPSELALAGRLEEDRLIFAPGSDRLPCQNRRDLMDWVELQGLQVHARELARSLAQGRLFCVSLGPDEGELARLLAAWGGDGDPYEVAEEAEERLGRARMELLFEEWNAALEPSPVAEALRRLGCPSFVMLPDRRYAGHSFPLYTEGDRERFWLRLEEELAPWRTDLTCSTLLFLGGGPELQELYRQLRMVFPAAPGQKLYCAASDLAPASLSWWQRRGFEVVRMAEAELLAEIAAQPVATPGCQGSAGPQRPYKFLDYYGDQDAPIFFGREQETAALLALVLSRPWLVLYGRSGVGKTSLLRAGLCPRLPGPQNLVLQVRCLADPHDLLRQECARLLGCSPDGSLGELLAALSERLSGHLVIVLDQFEEFFVRLGRERRVVFQRELGRALRAWNPRCHLIFSLREDFLAEMAEFESVVPAILEHRFRLTALTREQARRCIVGPAELFGLEVEPALIEALLAEGEQIDPPELQIVLDRLWTGPQQPLTLRAYEELGGVRSILLDYLHDTLDQELRQGPWEAELPRRLLQQLVTERGTKAVVTSGELDERLGSAWRPLMERLIQLRLVRSLGQDLFELAHEYLIEEIATWASEEELAARHAQVALRSELESWQSMGSLMGQERLHLIVREQGLLHPDRAERQLLLRASAVHGLPLEPWLASDDAEFLLELLAAGYPGAVQRSLIEALYPLELSDRGAELVLQAAESCSNPGLLARLPAGRLHEPLRERTRLRFFGPGKMVVVPAGPAWVGCPPELREARKADLHRYLHPRLDSERDLTRVELPDFRIDRCLVTNDDYAEFRPPHIDRYPDEEGSHPAVSLSWVEAQEYGQWLGKRLASEEEWEKAARGPDGRLFPWGNEFSPERLNSAESGLRTTTPVDAYPSGASPYGALDMAGNVWEWTGSAWAPEGPFKTQKGGSTLNPAPLQHASSRQEAFPDFVLQWVGFRLVADAG